ncbi:hypothetical protein MMC20_004840 [Loxospora ochrophaea]|nr:hypothetical protein [Loxospora ochrophaea]
MSKTHLLNEFDDDDSHSDLTLTDIEQAHNPVEAIPPSSKAAAAAAAASATPTPHSPLLPRPQNPPRHSCTSPLLLSYLFYKLYYPRLLLFCLLNLTTFIHHLAHHLHALITSQRNDVALDNPK